MEKSPSYLPLVPRLKPPHLTQPLLLETIEVDHNFILILRLPFDMSKNYTANVDSLLTLYAYEVKLLFPCI